MPRSPRAVECAFAVLVGATSLGATCVPNPNDHTPGGGVDMAVPEIGFAEIEMDIKAKCLTNLPGCHSPATTLSQFKIGDNSMDNYQVVKKFVITAMPDQSPFLLKSLGMGTPTHVGGVILMGNSDATYQKWLKWITAGAVFDPSQKPVVYADIEKDMTDGLRCGTTLGSCHSATAAKAMLKIGPDKAANYQLVKSMFLDLMTPAQSQLLTKALGQPTHEGGMPLMLNDPIYTKWLGWISNGAQEK